MLKYAALLFNTVALLIYQFFFADGITVTQAVPASASPGGEFTVELVINKGSVGGFAKLQQDLPEGFTAVEGENNGASFTFSNQSVKFIWMSLPSEKEFKIRYKVKVAANASGEKTIAGKFSYVSDNVKQAVEISPSVIMIGDGTSTTPVEANTAAATTPDPEPAATNSTSNTGNAVTTTSEPAANKTPEPSTTTNTEPAATTPAPSGSTEPSSVTCSRNAPTAAAGDFIVEITINKGTTSGFAKLLETLPAGFTATGMETEGGSFSFSEQKVKFVWVSMPSKPEFRISYKVTVAASVSGIQNIDGVFSYIENDETKKFNIPPSSINIGGSSAPIVNNTNTTGSENVTPGDNSAVNTPVADNTTATQPDNNVNTSNSTTANTSSGNDNSQLSATTIPSPQGNVNYKVQIMALRKAVDANVLATRYKYNERISTEMAEGFTKYTVGSHNEYKEARDARENAKNKGVAGPFVTAYNAGKRITVQEALMITSQKWFR